MNRWQPGSRSRRTLAHLATPLLAGLLASLLFIDSDTMLERMGVFVPGAYLVWLLLAFPVQLLTARKARKLWFYLACAGGFVGLPILVLMPIRSLADFGLALSYVSIALAAALFYWFCADWRPRSRESA